MIKNFKDKLAGRVLNVPVWSARQQDYIVTETECDYDSNGAWYGRVRLDWVASDYSVPTRIHVKISKPRTGMEWEAIVSMPNNYGLYANREVMVLPHHLKSPDTFGKLIADIVNNTNNNYFN
jgi:hypothetical protein